MLNRRQMKEARQEAILSSLGRLGFASRSQLQRIHNLGGDRNACRVLSDLIDYVNWFRDGENIYYLNKRGADRIGADRVLSRNQNYRHTLMRNDLYIWLGQPADWKNEQIVEVPGRFKIVVDAFFRDENGRPYFVEIDREQKMFENRRKIETYKRLKEIGALQKRFGNFPRLIWVTMSEVRRQKLAKWCDEAVLKADVYLWADIRNH